MEIIDKFEVTMTERSEKVIRGSPGLMSPVHEGELERGTQLPLAVSVAAREGDGRGEQIKEDVYEHYAFLVWGIRFAEHVGHFPSVDDDTIILRRIAIFGLRNELV